MKKALWRALSEYKSVQLSLLTDMQLKRSTYEALQILSISLTDKTPLRELFDKTYSNDIKEQFGPIIPG